jgi:hypothetical protein
MTTIKINNTTAIALCQKNQAGVTKYLGSLKTIQFAGTPTTATKINAVFQADIDATNALDEAEADIKQQRTAQRAARAAANAERASLKAYILGNYGPQAVQMLEDCGLPVPQKKGPATVASKAAAVAKGKATRAAGGAKAVKAKEAAAAAGTTTAPTGTVPAAAPATTPAK